MHFRVVLEQVLVPEAEVYLEVNSKSQHLAYLAQQRPLLVLDNQLQRLVHRRLAQARQTQVVACLVAPQPQLTTIHSRQAVEAFLAVLLVSLVLIKPTSDVFKYDTPV